MEFVTLKCGDKEKKVDYAEIYIQSKTFRTYSKMDSNPKKELVLPEEWMVDELAEFLETKEISRLDKVVELGKIAEYLSMDSLKEVVRQYGKSKAIFIRNICPNFLKLDLSKQITFLLENGGNGDCLYDRSTFDYYGKIYENNIYFFVDKGKIYTKIQTEFDHEHKYSKEIIVPKELIEKYPFSFWDNYKLFELDVYKYYVEFKANLKKTNDFYTSMITFKGKETKIFVCHVRRKEEKDEECIEEIDEEYIEESFVSNIKTMIFSKNNFSKNKSFVYGKDLTLIIQPY